MSYSLAELMIAAAAQSWRDDGEIMGTGIGPLPRIAVGVCKTLYNPKLATTDGECWYTTEPLGPGQSSADVEIEGWIPYDRVFSTLWGGKRHAMVAPVQMDRFGQTNISVIGDHKKPKSAMLGARGFPGNTASHLNSFMFTNHSTRSFVSGEVDYVCSPGFNPERFGGKVPSWLALGRIVTNLCVMDFGGPDNSIRVISLHPGVTFEEVQENTGFKLARLDNLPVTAAPTEAELEAMNKVDPKNVRSKILKDNPPGARA
ncbi:ketoacid CoA transferase [Brevundimonas sp. GN22]